MSNENKSKRTFDLEERTSIFSENIIDFCQSLKETTVTRPIISQLIRSATSIGSNYCEADCAESRRDFEHKLGICKKEAKETKYWLRMIMKSLPEFKVRAQELRKESMELLLIFSSIINKSKSKAA